MEHTCCNCKFFTQHYVLVRQYRFRAIDCGRCNLLKSKRKPSSYYKGCPLWQSNEEEQKEREEIKKRKIENLTADLFAFILLQTKIEDEVSPSHENS
jgi:hypothetical protein